MGVRRSQSRHPPRTPLRLRYARAPGPRPHLDQPIQEHVLSLSDEDPTAESTRSTTTRPAWLLLIGAAAGLALSAFGLLEKIDDGRASGLPAEAVARVGDRVIRRVDYERVLAGVEGDLRGPVDEAMQRRILDRMIDEELLVQRAIGLGLAAIDRRVRGELTSGLIDSIVSEADSEEPTAGEIENHFAANRDFFTRPGRLRARTLFFSTRSSKDATPGDDADGDNPIAGALARAQEAHARLAAGEGSSEVEAALADPRVSPLPNVLLPPAKVRDYVGPTLLEAIESAEVGVWSEPIGGVTGFHLVLLTDREEASLPPLAEIEDLVREDLKRRRGDEALGDYLEELRSEIPVTIDETIFEDKRLSQASENPLDHGRK
jgi:hypothetical protein